MVGACREGAFSFFRRKDCNLCEDLRRAARLVSARERIFNVRRVETFDE